MMSERMQQTAWVGLTEKYRPAQIAQMSTWGSVPDKDTSLAAIHTISMVPKGSTTVTEVNPLAPTDEWRVAPTRIPATHRHQLLRWG